MLSERRETEFHEEILWQTGYPELEFIDEK